MSKALFRRSIDACYAELAESAIYRPAAGGSMSVSIIPFVNLSSRSLPSGMLVQSESTMQVRVSDVASPKVGDQIEYDERTFQIRSAPQRGVADLIWFLDAPEVQG